MSVCQSIRPSLCLSAWNNMALTGRIYIKFGNRRLLKNLSRKKRFLLISYNNNGSLSEYLLTPWSRVFLEKLTGSQLVKKLLCILWNPKLHYPHSQMPTNCPYPEPARSSPYPHNPLPEDPY